MNQLMPSGSAQLVESTTSTNQTNPTHPAPNANWAEPPFPWQLQHL